MIYIRHLDELYYDGKLLWQSAVQGDLAARRNWINYIPYSFILRFKFLIYINRFYRFIYQIETIFILYINSDKLIV